MKIIKTEGILLNKVDFGEGDRIVKIFTKDYGKLSILLKGIKKSKKREKFASDLLNVSYVTLLKKDNRDLDICNDISLKRTFNIKDNFWKINIFFYIAIFLDKYIEENDKNIVLYNRAIKTFNYIEKEENKEKILISISYFLFMVIKEEGYEFCINEGNIFDIENSVIGSKISANYKRISNIEKNYINLLNKVDINAIYKLKLSIMEILDIISILELYIVYHLNLNIKKIKNLIREDM